MLTQEQQFHESVLGTTRLFTDATIKWVEEWNLPQAIACTENLLKRLKQAQAEDLPIKEAVS